MVFVCFCFYLLLGFCKREMARLGVSGERLLSFFGCLFGVLFAGASGVVVDV